MKDIPQPAPEPYSPGDQVRIYLDSSDPDAHTHDTICEITDVLTGDRDTETGRSTDVYSYRLRDLETEDELPLTVRHQDLVPTEDADAGTDHTCPECGAPVENLNSTDSVHGYWYCSEYEVKWFGE